MDAQDGVPSVGRPDPPEPPDGDRPSSSPFSRMTLFAFPISCVNSSQLPSTTAIPSLTVVATSREPRTSCLALPRFFKDPPCLQPFPIAFVRSSDMDAALNIRGSVDAPSSFTIRALLFLGSSTALPCLLPFPITFVHSSDMEPLSSAGLWTCCRVLRFGRCSSSVLQLLFIVYCLFPSPLCVAVT